MWSLKEMRLSTKLWLGAVGMWGALALGGASLTACENPYYCEGKNPLNSCVVDPLMGCDSQADCTEPGKAVCDLEGSRTCVQCTMTMDEACTGDTPVCGGDSCRGCTADAECGADGVCLPTGACTTADKVAFVAPQGMDNAMCAKAMPCAKVSSALALTPARAFIHVTGTIDDTVTVASGNVTIFGAANARLTHTGVGDAALTLSGSSQVVIFNLEINQVAGDGISVTGSASLSMTASKVTESSGIGIRMNGGELKLHRCHLEGNRGGGLSLIDAKFQIVNNFIVANGGMASNIGGATFVEVSTSVTGNLFELNTVAKNLVTGSTIPAGVRCASLTAPVKLSSNIVYANSQLFGNGINGLQVTADANCTWIHSNIGPMGVSGTTNLSADPMFVNFEGNNFHLGPSSPARDKADPASAVTIDIDGDVRPQGPAPDIGADEIR